MIRHGRGTKGIRICVLGGWESMEHRGFEFAPAGLVGAWLLGAAGTQFTTMPVRIPIMYVQTKTPPTAVSLFVVEHRGFEPLTSTLRTLRATNCANAPRVNAISIIHIREKKARIFCVKIFVRFLPGRRILKMQRGRAREWQRSFCSTSPIQSG